MNPSHKILHPPLLDRHMYKERGSNESLCWKVEQRKQDNFFGLY